MKTSVWRRNQVTFGPYWIAKVKIRAFVAVRLKPACLKLLLFRKLKKPALLNNWTSYCQSWHCVFVYGQILLCGKPTYWHKGWPIAMRMWKIAMWKNQITCSGSKFFMEKGLQHLIRITSSCRFRGGCRRLFRTPAFVAEEFILTNQ